MQVLVIAEVLKPEDRAVLAAAGTPMVTVLNKADLTGLGDGGPLPRAYRRAADFLAATRVPAVPMIAMLAVADLDDELMRALHTLHSEPADMTSTDAFVSCPHSLPAELRRRLLASLDRFGIARAVLALDEGGDVGTVLRRASQVDRVVAHIEAAGAPVRYHRLRAGITELQAFAVQFSDDELARLLETDTAVLAVMSAAVDVVEAAGIGVDGGHDAASHLHRAVRWRGYSKGPVSALHRRCGVDIARGSLRLLGQVHD
ncbi:hypothetical protein ACGFK1_26505 [Mycobacterium sp. NPDC048908]|uniref:hypothetical protein n=1 Tax=Mycobacterium sp. NPDC048908 TaxID=3364292 RepID=UPI0037172970